MKRNSIEAVTNGRQCDICNVCIPVKEWLYHLRTLKHRLNAAVETDQGLKCVKSIFNERIETYLCENETEELQSPKEFMVIVKGKVIKLLESMIEKHNCFKFNLELFAEYVKISKNTCQEVDNEYGMNIDLSVKSFNTRMRVVNQGTQLAATYDDMTSIIDKKCDEFQERDSGWALLRILHLEINVNQYKPIKCSQYLPLPSSIANKKACINVRNNDEYCFKWSIISALYKGDRNLQRTSTYQIENISSSTIYLNENYEDFLLEFGNLDFPLKVADIREFEILNESISVNVFGLEEVTTSKGCFYQIIGPYYNTKEEKGM